MLQVLGNVRLPRHPSHLSRRTILSAGGAGLLGLSLPRLLQAESYLQSQAAPTPTPKAKSVIFLMLFGGPSQLETFDMKPNAPDSIRGPFRPIGCRTPGLLMCEHLPRIADISDKLCFIRTMSHSFNDHSGGAHYLQTGKRWHVPIGGGFTPTPRDWPSIGSVCDFQHQSQTHGSVDAVPNYMVVPNSLGRLQDAGQYPRPGEHAGWLGQRYNPLTTSIDKRSSTDNPYWRECTDEELRFELPAMRMQDGITLDRMQSRSNLLEQWHQQRPRFEAQIEEMDLFRKRAAALVSSSQTGDALNIRQETAAVRDRYGRHLFGQSCLMARRLIEAGVRFVTVHYDCVDGYSWDSHKNSADVKQHLLPTFDQAYSALIADLESRGLLDETLVVATGEMGRTPKANAEWGRDHWSTLFSTVLAGGGSPPGLIGTSDHHAAYPKDRAYSPEDLAATLYAAMGIDPELRLPSPDGRPVNLVEGGKPIFS